MQGRKHTTKQSSLKQKFQLLIESLRTKTVLKDKAEMREQIEQILQPIKSQLNRQICDVVPVTQDQIDNEASLSSPRGITSEKSVCTLLSTEMNHRKGINQKIEQIEQDETIQHQQPSPLKQNRSNKLNPDKKLQLPPNQGRSGEIRHQALSVNANFKKIEQRELRYVKLNKRMEQTVRCVPSNTIKQKITFKQLNDIEVIKFWNRSVKLTENSSSRDMFLYFQELVRDLNIILDDSIIRKYKNCVYFGQNSSNLSIYQGMIYYFQNKLYYGEFLNGIKHGHGVEINFNDDSKYAGNFNAGKKNGYFFVQKMKENYQGILQYGIYHGQGKLMTQHFIYNGNFQDGKKHGYGEQYYPKTGLKLKGFFVNGQYQNMNQKQAKESASEPQLSNKLSKISNYPRSQSIDFNIVLPNNTNKIYQKIPQKRQKSAKRIVQLEQFPFHEDSKSLFDIINETEKKNKYDFSPQNISRRFPKINLQGLQKQSSFPMQDIIINKKSKIVNHNSRISRQKYSQQCQTTHYEQNQFNFEPKEMSPLKRASDYENTLIDQ